jgi:hypothetical protein
MNITSGISLPWAGSDNHRIATHKTTVYRKDLFAMVPPLSEPRLT